jgi:hypothetical protein
MATILTDDAACTVASFTTLTPSELRAVTGYELKPQGLCRDDICVPAAGLDTSGGIDLWAAAAFLRRPLAIEDDTGDAALAAPVPALGESVVGQSVADLVLHDLDGNEVAWSAVGRKKKVLVTWASW